MADSAFAFLTFGLASEAWVGFLFPSLWKTGMSLKYKNRKLEEILENIEKQNLFCRLSDWIEKLQRDCDDEA